MEQGKDPDERHPAWIESVVGVLGALGFNRVRLRWRLLKLVADRRAAGNRRAQRALHVGYEHRVCPECTAVNDRAETTCQRCGAALGARALEVAGRLGLRLPRATTVLIALALIAVFVRTALATPLGAPWAIDLRVLIEHGALRSTAADAELSRLATAIVLHAGLFHLGFNLLALMVAGPMIEELYGRWATPAIFVVTGLAASATSAFLGDVALVSVGASGAIMGLVGAGAGAGQRAGTRRGQTQRNEMLLWALFVVVFGFFVGADQWAHLGGFAAGGVVGLLVPPARTRGKAGAVAGALALALLAVACAAAIAPWSV